MYGLHQEFLHYICDQVIPVDLMDVFQQAGVPFFEGMCACVC